MQFPTIAEFLPKAFLFDGTPFAFNRIQLVRFVMIAFVTVFFCTVASKSLKRAKAGNVVPTKPQLVVEMLFDFVRNFTFDSLGEKTGKKWLPLVTTIFCSVFFLNLSGIVPGLNIAGTSGMGIPFLFAVWVFTSYWREGISSHGGGIKGFFIFMKDELFPSGLPIFVYPVYAVVEFLQVILIRPASLAIRLFSNMMAGHMLLGICFAATQGFLIGAPGISRLMMPAGVITLAGSFIFILFELLVAALQAYIYSFLTVSYLETSMAHEPEND
ncbi:MAG: F0F1 ATP synthase subunit A [Candidatus Ancillula sp.]|jgi:F-type H+-transporting ATPase subunit a|nr:F0F1 ATP synthase subunit A [Candidatus Ancillula sp.]